MKLRPLTASEVTFTVKLEPENGAPTARDLPDEHSRRHVQIRLANGESEAWCCVVVTAQWRGYRGEDTLSQCSLDSTYTRDVAVAEHDMKARALEALNAHLVGVALDIQTRIADASGPGVVWADQPRKMHRRVKGRA